MTGVEGIGIGLRYAMAEQTLTREVPGLRWLEIHPENYVARGGRFRHILERAAEKFPFATHGLTLGFGAAEPAEASYMRALRDFLHGLSIPWHSEHLCFSGSGGVMVHDLLPLPFTREAVQNAAARIAEARDQLELPIAIENISYYATLGRADEQEMPELEFLLEVLERADCKLLLDVNNVFVNSQNHGFDPRAYIDRIPVERVAQIHVAGHHIRPDNLIIDTHGEAVRDEVFDLLEYTLGKTGAMPVLLERDQGFPQFDEIIAEVARLDAIYQRAVTANTTAKTTAKNPKERAA